MSQLLPPDSSEDLYEVSLPQHRIVRWIDFEGEQTSPRTVRNGRGVRIVALLMEVEAAFPG